MIVRNQAQNVSKFRFSRVVQIEFKKKTIRQAFVLTFSPLHLVPAGEEHFIVK